MTYSNFEAALSEQETDEAGGPTDQKRTFSAALAKGQRFPAYRSPVDEAYVAVHTAQQVAVIARELELIHRELEELRRALAEQVVRLHDHRATLDSPTGPWLRHTTH